MVKNWIANALHIYSLYSPHICERLKYLTISLHGAVIRTPIALFSLLHHKWVDLRNKNPKKPSCPKNMQCMLLCTIDQCGQITFLDRFANFKEISQGRSHKTARKQDFSASIYFDEQRRPTIPKCFAQHCRWTLCCGIPYLRAMLARPSA